MIYKIVCSGQNDFKDLYKKDSDEIIIACDGGYDAIKEMNLNCDYFFGDLDSVKEMKINCLKYLYNPVKDDTDLEIAIKFVASKYQVKDEIIIYNATGMRLDHYEGAIRLLKKYKKYNMKIVDSHNEIYILKNFMNMNQEKIYKKNDFKYISFFNFEDDTIISLRGFKYELDSYLMKEDDCLCISNEIIGESKIIYNKNLLVIESK